MQLAEGALALVTIITTGTACGSGTAAIATLIGGGGGKASNQPILVSDVQIDPAPGNGRAAPISFSFRLTDRESDRASMVEILVVPPDGGPSFPAALVGAPSNASLASSPAGSVHARTWDYASQLSLGSAFAAGYRLEVAVVGGSSRSSSPVFSVGNDAPSLSAPVPPSGELSGFVRLEFDVADSASDLVSVALEYDDLDQPQGWRAASSAGPAPTNVTAAPGGVPVVVFWDAPADESGRAFRARLRLTPSDAWASGTPVTTDLDIDNNAEPLVILSGSAFFADPDARRGLPLPMSVVDAEGDTVRVVVQWRTPFQPFPALPSSPVALAALLADPVQVRAHQIATEIPSSHRGRIVPTADPAVVRLPELAGAESVLQAATLVGRELELLRPNGAPARVGASWAPNPLVSPVAALPSDDGAFVLESVQGGWRLREIDLATGAIVADVASDNARVPDALSTSSDGRALLVADDAGGLWRLASIDVASGAVTPLYTSSGASALGPVRGLVALGVNTALVTVAGSLIRVDWGAPSPSEQVLFSDFAGACGLAYDRAHGGRVFLAERDWVDPLTSTVSGRVVRIALDSRERVGVAVTGTPLSRPRAVALERDGTRLLALTDATSGDGAVELRAVELGGSDRGNAYEIVAGLPDDASGLATGVDGLRLVALPTSADLALGGGVLERRRIEAFDPATLAVTTAPPFDVAPRAAQPWRVRDVAGDRPAAPQGTNDSFLWDSRDVPRGGAVILRGVPYDDEQGLATDTGVPRVVRSGIDVPATDVGGPVVTDGVAGLDLADLDGDGQLDLVTANVGTDRVTAFYQISSGTFPSSASLTLAGVPALAPMTDPVAVRVLDVDHDGDVDIVAVGRGSNNFSVFRQQPAGSFSAVVPLLVTGLNQPSDLASADMNGDGLLDLVIADTGQNQVEVFNQLLAGLYSTSSSTTLGNGSTLAPSALGIGDLDGDGDLDLVSADTGSDNLALYLHGAGGFAAAPSRLLGGAGVTNSPTDVVVADLDLDGRLDLACADQGGDALAVFFQGASGFAATPDALLSDSAGPVGPLRLAAADMNGDGAPDLVSLDAGDDLALFTYDDELGAYLPEPLILGATSGFLAPSCLGVADVDGDGFADIAAGDSAADVVKFFYHDDGAVFTAQPELTLGSQVDTPQVSAVAAADLDGDGDLDLASANAGDGTLCVYRQVSPAVILAEPAQRLSSSALTPSVRAVAAADVDGDGRADLVGAVPSPGKLALFRQRADGTFSLVPDALLGGTLGAPAHVLAADLDGDGAPDLACANETGDGIALFLRSSGSFAQTPSGSLGGPATTNGPVHLAAGDLDGDGDLDLACANRDGNDLALFLAGPAGLPAAPSRRLGGGGSTDSPRALVLEDFDCDGRLDVAAVCANENGLALFFQHAPGTFSAGPDLVLTHALVSLPTTLASADLDHDGDQDLVCGAQGGPDLVVFRQTSPGHFAAVPSAIGGPGSVDSVLSLLALDLDGDADTDLVSAHPSLNRIALFFGSH